jgi:hypothetical protein
VTPNGSSRNGTSTEKNGSGSRNTASENEHRVALLTGARNGASHKSRTPVKNNVKRQTTPAKVKAAAR